MIKYYCPECDELYEIAYKQMDGQPICVVCSAIVEIREDDELDDILDALEN